MIFGVNTTSDILKLLYVISRAIRRVKFETILKYHEWYLCQISQQILLLFVYTTTCKRFVIFTCRYFKWSWNTTSLSQSNCRNFSCSSIMKVNSRFHFFQWRCFQIKHYSQTSMSLMATSPQRPFFWWTVHTLTDFISFNYGVSK